MSTITLSTQTVVSLAAGDILELPISAGQARIIGLNVGGDATLRPLSGGTVDGTAGDYSIGTGNYVLFTSGGQGATWCLLSEGGGASNVVTSPDSESRELVAGTNITFDTSTNGQLEINASGGGGGELQHARVTISSAEILDLHNTPVQLIAAPGAGKTLIPLMFYAKLNFNSISYATIGEETQMVLLYSNSSGELVSGQRLGNTNFWTENQSVIIFFGTSWSGATYPIIGASNRGEVPSGWENQPIVIFADVGNGVTTGNSTVTIDIWYVVTP